MKKDEQYYFYINDHLGTPQKIFAENGQAVWEAYYTAFGMASVQKEIIENNLRFPGQYYDAETGLHYNWHRFYDPSTGRYITADPIGLAGGINLYAYVGGNPVNWVDVMGLTANCPATVEWARLMRTQFIRYPNRKGEEMFHCGYECYLENRSEGYCPDNPGAECCYDEKGLLVDENHKYAKCGGSNDDYFCKSMTETPIDCMKHAGPGDRGGIWNRGEEAKKETRRHYCDTHPGACEKN